MTTQTIWGLNRQTVICEHCHSVYLAEPAAPPTTCPGCQRDVLNPIEGDADQLHLDHEPELILPFAVSPEVAAHRALSIKEDIPFPPSDLKDTILRQRLQSVYLPVWLVDADVRATWQSEVGFNYEVVSHRERYARKSWVTEEVKETRLRWEPRVGRLQRRYDNITAPALENYETIVRQVGAFDTVNAPAYDQSAVAAALVQIPDRLPDDAWSDALPGFRSAAVQDCRRAASADKVRGFHWTMQYKDRRWTQLLVPLYTTFYHDDDGIPRRILINGQTGRVWAERRASVKRARRLSIILGVLAFLIFACSAVALLAAAAAPPIIVLAGVGLLVTIGLGIGAVLPLVRANRFNNRQPRSR